MQDIVLSVFKSVYFLAKKGFAVDGLSITYSTSCSTAWSAFRSMAAARSRNNQNQLGSSGTNSLS